MSRRNWLASIMALGLIDMYAAYIKHDGTLSQAARETFKTNTVAGKLVWVSSWALLTRWVIPHIWNWPKDRLERMSS